jgi:hypothetical protein
MLVMNHFLIGLTEFNKFSSDVYNNCKKIFLSNLLLNLLLACILRIKRIQGKTSHLSSRFRRTATNRNSRKFCTHLTNKIVAGYFSCTLEVILMYFLSLRG